MKRTHLMVAMLVVAVSACASDGDDQRSTDSTPSVPDEISPTTRGSIDSPPTDTAAPATPISQADQETPVTDDNQDNQEGSTTVPTGPPPSVQPLYEPGDIDRGLQPFINQAIDDLTARLDVDTASITVRAAVLVVWPDASIGCPQPDMEYAQVATDGSVIELDHDDKTYRYHTGGTRGPFICEQPITKAPPGELLSLDDFGNDDIDD